MEIVTGTEAGSGEGAAGAAGAEGAEGAGAQPDVGKLLGEFGTTITGLVEKVDGLSTRFDESQEQAAAGGQGGGEESGGGGEETQISMPQYTMADFDEDGALTLEAQAREMNRIAQEMADQRVQAGLAEINAERAAEREEAAWERRDAEADALEAKYPDLADEKTADHYLAIAKEEAERFGHPELAMEPGWLERVYLTEQAREKAGGEIPAGDEQGVHVERGSAVQTAAGGGSQDDGDRIVALAQQRRHRI